LERGFCYDVKIAFVGTAHVELGAKKKEPQTTAALGETKLWSFVPLFFA